MRYFLRDLVAYLFSKVIVILRLNPGDVVIVYDQYIAHRLGELRSPIPFQVPIITAICNPGEEHEILRKLSFQEFNTVWNMAYHSYAEDQWKIAQDRYYLFQGDQSQKVSRPYHLLRKSWQRLESIRSKLVEWVDGLGRRPSVQPSELTLLKQGLIAGKGQKQLSALSKKSSTNLSGPPLTRRSEECLRVAKLQRAAGEVELAEFNEALAQVNREMEDESFG